MNSKIHKEYAKFFSEMEKEGINWAIIKDIHFIIEKGYDNEIDLVVRKRKGLKEIADKLGWHSSALNEVNSHVIFWKFDRYSRPVRLDFHIRRVLATAAPWIKAEELLRNKLKKGGLWTISPKYELAVLLIASLRGRMLKEHRVLRARELSDYVSEAYSVCRKKISEKEFLRVYRRFIRGRETKWARIRRLGLFGCLRLRMRECKILMKRVLCPARVISLIGKGKDKRMRAVCDKLKRSKIKARCLPVDNLFDSFKIFMLRRLSDIVIVDSLVRGAEKINLNRLKASSSKKIIRRIYP